LNQGFKGAGLGDICHPGMDVGLVAEPRRGGGSGVSRVGQARACPCEDDNGDETEPERTLRLSQWLEPAELGSVEARQMGTKWYHWST
jgi:hypothetical protein